MRLKKEELLEFCRGILDVERQSKDMYENYLKKIEDKEIRETLEGILKDEIGHIEIAKELVRILE
ncbi:hypothetical protein LR013_03180 [candidate division NPL-UPA2 bacterium]|nr:hypothetical protein [candidate division NPL-UPA2 bacterium]